MSEELWKAALGAGATVLVAVVGLIGLILQSRKTSTTKPPTSETPLEEFNGTQNEFMVLVIRDNKELRGLLDGQAKVLTELQDSVKIIKIHQESFAGAVRRYLRLLAAAWKGPEPMPWPDDADFHLLEETLPSQRRFKE